MTTKPPYFRSLICQLLRSASDRFVGPARYHCIIFRRGMPRRLRIRRDLDFAIYRLEAHLLGRYWHAFLHALHRINSAQLMPLRCPVCTRYFIRWGSDEHYDAYRCLCGEDLVSRSHPMSGDKHFADIGPVIDLEKVFDSRRKLYGAEVEQDNDQNCLFDQDWA